MAMLTLYVVCKLHDFSVMVGPGSLLSEYECPTCIDIADANAQWRPCCPYMNTTCCGHDDGDGRSEDDPKWAGVTIDSPNYRNYHRPANLSDDSIPF